MSETFVINTDSKSTKIIRYEPFLVFADTLPLLKQKMPIFDFSKPIIDPVELSSRLKLTMKNYNGLGLAANQCNIPARCFVIQDGEKQIEFFNPRILESSEENNDLLEGCLSFPGLTLKISRSNYIIAEYENESGATIQSQIAGLSARIFQHELDHLNGVKFTERVGKIKLHMAKKTQQKILRKYKKVYNNV